MKLYSTSRMPLQVWTELPLKLLLEVWSEYYESQEAVITGDRRQEVR